MDPGRIREAQQRLSASLYDVGEPIVVEVQPDASLRSLALLADAVYGRAVVVSGMEILAGGIGEREPHPGTCWHVRVDLDEGVAIAQAAVGNGAPNLQGREFRLAPKSGGCTVNLANIRSVLDGISSRCFRTSIYGEMEWSVAKEWLKVVPHPRLLLFSPDKIRPSPRGLPPCEASVLPTDLPSRISP